MRRYGIGSLYFSVRATSPSGWPIIGNENVMYEQYNMMRPSYAFLKLYKKKYNQSAFMTCTYRKFHVYFFLLWHDSKEA